MKLSFQFLSTRGSKHYMQCTANCILVEFKARSRTLLQKIFLKMFKKNPWHAFFHIKKFVKGKSCFACFEFCMTFFLLCLIHLEIVCSFAHTCFRVPNWHQNIISWNLKKKTFTHRYIIVLVYSNTDFQ